MVNGWELVTAPTAEPVDRDTDLKPLIRVTGTDNDTLLAALLVRARRWVEQIIGRGLINQTWRVWLNEWPPDSWISLPMAAPAGSITHLKHYSTADVAATVSNTTYSLDAIRQPSHLVLKANQVWPSATLRPVNGIECQYVCGFGSAGSSVPGEINQAILLLAGAWWDDPEAEPPKSVRSLLFPYRVTWL